MTRPPTGEGGRVFCICGEVSSVTREKTTTERGYGAEHQRIRQRLMRNLRQGAPCWWCGRGMYADKTRNFDGRSLNADHGVALAKGGTKADRLLHDTCNKQRGDGSRDELRPAVTGMWPPITDKTVARFEWGQAVVGV